MNVGLRRAGGHFSHVLNADDLILQPGRYGQCLLDARNADHRLLLSSIVYFQRPGHRTRHEWRVATIPDDRSFWQQRIRSGLHYPHPGFMAASDLYRTVGFDCRYGLSADYKLMQTLLLRADLSERVSTCLEALRRQAATSAAGCRPPNGGRLPRSRSRPGGRLSPGLELQERGLDGVVRER